MIQMPAIRSGPGLTQAVVGANAAELYWWGAVREPAIAALAARPAAGDPTQDAQDPAGGRSAAGQRCRRCAMPDAAG